eukprot:Rmarinus@m.25354
MSRASHPTSEKALKHFDVLPPSWNGGADLTAPSTRYFMDSYEKPPNRSKQGSAPIPAHAKLEWSQWAASTQPRTKLDSAPLFYLVHGFLNDQINAEYENAQQQIAMMQAEIKRMDEEKELRDNTTALLELQLTDLVKEWEDTETKARQETEIKVRSLEDRVRALVDVDPEITRLNNRVVEMMETIYKDRVRHRKELQQIQNSLNKAREETELHRMEAVDISRAERESALANLLMELQSKLKGEEPEKNVLQCALLSVSKFTTLSDCYVLELRQPVEPDTEPDTPRVPDGSPLPTPREAETSTKLGLPERLSVVAMMSTENTDRYVARGEGVSWEALDENKPILIPAVSESSQLKFLDPLLDAKRADVKGGFVCVPIITPEGVLYGVLAGDTVATGATVTENDVSFLQTVAEQVGHALDELRNKKQNVVVKAFRRASTLMSDRNLKGTGRGSRRCSALLPQMKRITAPNLMDGLVEEMVRAGVDMQEAKAMVQDEVPKMEVTPSDAEGTAEGTEAPVPVMRRASKVKKRAASHNIKMAQNLLQETPSSKKVDECIALLHEIARDLKLCRRDVDDLRRSRDPTPFMVQLVRGVVIVLNLMPADRARKASWKELAKCIQIGGVRSLFKTMRAFNPISQDELLAAQKYMILDECLEAIDEEKARDAPIGCLMMFTYIVVATEAREARVNILAELDGVEEDEGEDALNAIASNLTALPEE